MCSRPGSLLLFNFKIMRIEYIIAAGAIAYFLLKDQFNRVGYGLKGVKIIKKGKTGIQISISVSVRNGSSVPLKVDGFIGKLSKNGVHIADLALINKASIEPGQEKDIMLGADVSYTGAISSVLESIYEFANDKDIPFTVRGRLLAIGREIPVNFTSNAW